MTDAERFVADVLMGAGSTIEPVRVGEAYADQRIAEQILRFAEPETRAGMQALDKTLRDRDVPAGVRLHLVSAVAHLSRLGASATGARRPRRGPE